MAAKLLSVYKLVRRSMGDFRRLEPSFNAQINSELFAGYTYLAMANHFARQSVALPGCRAFYMEQMREEWSHVQKLMEFVCRRGGRVELLSVPQPERQDWDAPLSVFRDSLKLETDVTQKILNLHSECTGCGDLAATNFLESEFLDHQIEALDRMSRYIAEIERMGCDGLAVQLFDQFLLKDSNQSHS